MLLTHGTLSSLTTGFRTAFAEGMQMAGSGQDFAALVTTVQSSSSDEEYGWLNRLPGLREWSGDRLINQVTASGYTLRNRDFEQTIAVNRNDIEDDRYGIYGTMFRAMGEAIATFPNEHVFALLRDGGTGVCFDGKPFFATDHPRLNARGKETTYSNDGGGSSTAWYLLDTSRMLRPLIRQIRKQPEFTRLDASNDENVFMRNEYLYGAHCREAFGYGLPFLAIRNRNPLTAAAFNATYAAMQGMRGDHDRPLGLRPTHLIVPPSLRAAALEVIRAERDASGATNINRDVVSVLATPWLA